MHHDTNPLIATWDGNPASLKTLLTPSTPTNSTIHTLTFPHLNHTHVIIRWTNGPSLQSFTHRWNLENKPTKTLVHNNNHIIILVLHRTLTPAALKALNSTPETAMQTPTPGIDPILVLQSPEHPEENWHILTQNPNHNRTQ
jgi:hypothetical protein